MPPAPWDCELRGVCLLSRWGMRPAVLAAVDYSRTPVGAYHEALVATYALPFGVRVPWIVVDSAASAVAGRELWRLPKRLCTAWLELGEGWAEARIEADATFHLSAEARGRAFPFAAPAVLRQPGRGAAWLLFTGHARLAVVICAGTLPRGLRGGTRPGMLLAGRLRIAPAGYTALPTGGGVRGSGG